MGKKSKAHQRNLARARAKRSHGHRGRGRRRRWDIRKVGIAVLVATLGVLLVVTFIPGFTGLAPTVDDPAAPDDLPPFDDDDPVAGGVACDGEVPAAADEEKPQWDDPPDMVIDPGVRYRATIETSCGAIVVDLFASESPTTVNNFVFLAREGFYDGVVFHRIIDGFMVQGGDPTGTGMGGPGYRFEDELDLARERGYPRGTVAMANAGPNTNGSQFFLVSGIADHLPPQYSVFGEIVEGLDTLALLSGLETDGRDRPLQTAYIESITIEDLGPADPPPDDDADAPPDDDADGGADDDDA